MLSMSLTSFWTSNGPWYVGLRGDSVFPILGITIFALCSIISLFLSCSIIFISASLWPARAIPCMLSMSLTSFWTPNVPSTIGISELLFPIAGKAMCALKSDCFFIYPNSLWIIALVFSSSIFFFSALLWQARAIPWKLSIELTSACISAGLGFLRALPPNVGSFCLFSPFIAQEYSFGLAPFWTLLS